MNVMEYAILFSEDDRITLESLPKSLLDKQDVTAEDYVEFTKIEQMERELIIQFIKETDGNLSEVARRCNIARTTLYRKMKKYRINNMIHRI